MTSLNNLDTLDIHYMLECFSKHQLIALDKILELVILGVEPEVLRSFIHSIRRRTQPHQTRRVTPFSFDMDTGVFGTPFWDHGEDPIQAQYLVGHLNRNYGIKMKVSRSQAMDAEFFKDSFYDDIAKAIKLAHE